MVEGGQELALVVVHLGHAAPDGRAVDVDVEDGEEDRDLRGAGAQRRARGRGHHLDHLAVRRRDHQARVLQDLAVGVAEEERREEAEQRQDPPSQ